MYMYSFSISLKKLNEEVLDRWEATLLQPFVEVEIRGIDGEQIRR